MTEDTPSDVAAREIYALIGDIASGWSHIEQSVDTTIWWLAATDARYGACATAQIQSLHYRLLALVALLRLHGVSDGLITEVNLFSNNAGKVAKKRNRVIHDPISIEETGEVSAVTITADRKLAYGFSGDKQREYTAIGLEVYDLLRAYQVIDTKIVSELSTLPRRPV